MHKRCRWLLALGGVMLCVGCSKPPPPPQTVAGPVKTAPGPPVPPPVSK